MRNIVIACVDIGSPQNGNVGYSIFYDGKPVFPSKDCSPDVISVRRFNRTYSIGYRL